MPVNAVTVDVKVVEENQRDHYDRTCTDRARADRRLSRVGAQRGAHQGAAQRERTEVEAGRVLPGGNDEADGHAQNAAEVCCTARPDPLGVLWV